VQALRKAIQQHVAANIADLRGSCVFVRIFADLRVLCEEEGHNLQLLAGFAAGFSSEDSFADMIDVRERKVVSAKIEGMPRTFKSTSSN